MAEPETISPSDLASKVGISESHACNILRGNRAPSRAVALRIWEKTGLKTGPIAQLSDGDIRALARIEAKAA